jgi:hypothetical protein
MPYCQYIFILICHFDAQQFDSGKMRIANENQFYKNLEMGITILQLNASNSCKDMVKFLFNNHHMRTEIK